MRQADSDLAVILEHCPGALLVTDAHGSILHASRRTSELLGHEPGSLSGRSIGDLMLAPYAQAFEQFMERYRRNPEKHALNPPRRMHAMHASGRAIPVEFNLSIHESDHSDIRFVAAMREISELLDIERRLADEQVNVAATLSQIGEGVVRLDEDGQIIYANARACDWFHADEPLGRELTEVIALEDEITGELMDFGVDGLDGPVSKLALLYPGEHQRMIEVQLFPFTRTRGGKPYRVVIMHDVTEREIISRRIKWQNEHDPLTGLVNRRQLLRQMDRVRLAGDGDHHALLFLDLDQFKLVNDIAGHIAGDELLRQLAVELKQHLRSRDLVARLGGDEFAVLLANCPLPIAKRIAGDMIRRVQEFRYRYNGDVFQIGASVGVASLDEHEDPATVLRQADQACYQAKDLGRNNFVVYSETTDDDPDRTLGMHRITKALDQDRCLFRLQEIRPLADAEQQSYWEVLIRLVSSKGEEIMPGAFLPVAERYSHMHHIDRWVFENLAKQLKPLVEEFGPEGVPDLSINVSAQSLSNRQLCKDIPRLLETSGLPLDKFCIEITETAAISNIVATRSFLTDLNDRGCRIAIDDFGAGMASFNYLRDLPIDVIKIDGSIVRDIETDELDYKIVQSIQQIAEVMDCRSVAEFVETDGICAQLRNVGVDYVQGYAIGRPILMSDWQSRAIKATDRPPERRSLK